MISKSAADAGASLAQPRPYPPDQMKSAVAIGALTLAMQSLDFAGEVENPLAMIVFGADVLSANGAARARRVTHIYPLANRDKVTVRGSFVIGRIIPGLEYPEGLDDRLQLFDRLDHKPYQPISPEIPDLAAGEYRVMWGNRDGERRLTLEALNGLDSMTFGPFPESRVYE